MGNLAIDSARRFRETLEVGPERIEYRSSFPVGLRIRCLPGCGLCCRTYRISLTHDDLDRLRRVVGPEACSSIVLEDRGQSIGIAGFMENGKGRGCRYLDDCNRCTVYHSRPLYCRTYPLVRDAYAWLEMSVDHTCPGVGIGAAVTTGQIANAFLMEAEHRPGCLDARQSSASYGLICGSLKAKGVYADVELMQEVSAALIERGLAFRRDVAIAVFLSDAAAALAGLLAGAGNVQSSEDGIRLIEELGDRRFPAGVAKTGPGGLDPGPREGNELSDRARDALADYVGEWLHRQALLRFVHAIALARPRSANVLQTFFGFLADVVSTVLVSAEDLRKRRGLERISVRVMRAAIRSNDGPLRRRCASVVSSE